MPTLSRRNDKILSSIILILVGSYLAFEVSFTSYLIDFLSKPRTHDEILFIERFGRMLTGIAFALVFVGSGARWALKRFGVNPPVVLILVVVVAPLALYASYRSVAWGIERLVVHLTDQTTATQRREALTVTAVIDRLHAFEGEKPVLTLNDEFVPESLARDNESRIALAALPFLLSRVPDFQGRAMKVLERSVQANIKRELGAPEKAYNDLFVRPMRDLIGPAYSGYIKAVNAYRKARYERIHRADQEFDEYREELARHHLTVDTAKTKRSIRDRVRKRLIEKNPRFRSICDRKGLPDSVSDFDEVVVATIEDEYAAALKALGLATMKPPDGAFTLKDFTESPQVKELWRRELRRTITPEALAAKTSEFGPALGSSNLIYQDYYRLVYKPYVDDLFQEKMSDLSQSVEKYTGNDPLGLRAYDAMKAIVVIPIAIVFSMVGALTHLTKVVALSLRLLGVPSLVGWIGAMTLAFTLVIFSYHSASDQFERWGPAKLIVEGLPQIPWWPVRAEVMLKATIAIQSRLYPLGIAIRRETGILPSTQST